MKAIFLSVLMVFFCSNLTQAKLTDSGQIDDRLKIGSGQSFESACQESAAIQGCSDQFTDKFVRSSPNSKDKYACEVSCSTTSSEQNAKANQCRWCQKDRSCWANCMGIETAKTSQCRWCAEDKNCWSSCLQQVSSLSNQCRWCKDDKSCWSSCINKQAVSLQPKPSEKPKARSTL